MNNLPRIFVVAPTFRELHLVREFLDSWTKVECVECVILICNGNPGDETSELIATVARSYRHTVMEIEGSPDRFWSGLVELGFRVVKNKAAKGDFVLLSNVDISFANDIVAPMLDQFKLKPNSQIAALAVNTSGKLLSAGVQVRSWLLSLNKQLFLGLNLKNVGLPRIVPSTYLPTRFVLFPAKAINVAGIPNTRRLPHYCSDFEFTNRLRLAGYSPYVFTGAIVRNFEANTGFKSFQQRTTLSQRLRRCFDIKCTYNFKYRFWFVWLTYPKYSIPIGMFTHFAKIVIEMLFGGQNFLLRSYIMGPKKKLWQNK